MTMRIDPFDYFIILFFIHYLKIRLDIDIMGKGMKRKIDKLGRIVIPKSLRNDLGVDLNDEISMTLSDGCIIIRKPLSICAICNKGKTFLQINNKQICQTCFKKINSLES